MKDRLSIMTIFCLTPMMRPKDSFRLAMMLGLIVSLDIIAPCVFLPQNSSVAQQLKRKKKISPPPAPPSRGVPGNRTVSASRSRCDLNLVALAPQFSTNTPGQVSENSVWGKTTSSSPTFWFFVPATSSSTQLEFSLQNQEEEDVYRASIPTPLQPGIIGVKVSPKQPLQPNINYHWRLKAKVSCGTSTPNRVYVDGWVTQVSLSGVMSQKDNSEIYAEKGIWYDAVTSLAQQRLQRPNDLKIRQDWRDLLESANLEEIAKQPLIKTGD
jgi:Domain of Unknown Function (DUF928)